MGDTVYRYLERDPVVPDFFREFYIGRGAVGRPADSMGAAGHNPELNARVRQLDEVHPPVPRKF